MRFECSCKSVNSQQKRLSVSSHDVVLPLISDTLRRACAETAAFTERQRDVGGIVSSDLVHCSQVCFFLIKLLYIIYTLLSASTSGLHGWPF